MLLATRLIFIALCLPLAACRSAESYWSDDELDIIASLNIASLGELPAAPSNRFANNHKAAVLGRKLFFDKRFSKNDRFSCASCHQPEKAFTDGLRRGNGVNPATRNTQSLIGAAYQTWFYWDGRKDSLWSQALVPFEAADEMAGSRVEVLRVVGQDQFLRRLYEEVFGDFPSSIFDTVVEKAAGPWGDARTRDNWHRIPVTFQKQINSAYANIGKAIAAYERTIAVPATRFDAYSDLLLSQGENQADDIIDENEKAGLKLFIDQDKTHCLRCHNGPLFSNMDFHNIGSGNFTGPELDFGRFLGVQAVMQDEFNCLGNYSDARSSDCHALRFLAKDIHHEMQGAYKTPSLRYLDVTAPYFHDGRHATIAEVLNHYLDIPFNSPELPQLSLTEKERMQLQSFLATLYRRD